MNFSTFIGLIVGIVIVLWAMSMGSSILIFFNIPGLMIVFGGTVAATMIRYSLKEAIYSIKMSFRILMPSTDIQDKEELIELTDQLVRSARQNGIVSLEKIEVRNEFYQYGVRMLVDNYPRELVRQTLKEENRLLVERAQTSAGVFSSIGGAAPAFGMIGTLVGLVQMLSNLSDPSSIGPAMAVAMLTTLYGAMIANLFALPLADKIAVWGQEESIRQQMIIDAVDFIAKGLHHSMLRDVLSPYLDKKPNFDEEVV
ncbi:motility protein A [Hydrogenovibrio marinus]|uniref:Biopolymer transporter ExbB n=1 Tax=Hydrogenovibrio marinus TaxID=28885 RepID=A0A066ZT10_HYDMR|nr:MotA/TolQ/ExbB proton channel family protein [Hydrogenovibrio marinus]KDN96622.1 biopolymer transporter ExbB [Hydrogenovibrio marinus]BBN60169.1 flagellar motor protein PomA [Hydrogenovibrio marinus]